MSTGGGRGNGGAAERAAGRLGRAALEAAAAGHHVFPVWPRSKNPAVKDWEHAATRDPEQIRRWWSQRPYNLAIACGPSGLVVVDLDTAHGEDAPPPWTGARHGRYVLHRLAEQAGQVVPRTYTVATPSGGLHLYYRAPSGEEAVELRNTAGTLGWRIDSRACGGFIVAAGSVRREGVYRVVDGSPIARLPEWIATELAPPAIPEPVALPPLRRSGQQCGRAQAYVAAIVEREAAQVAAAAAGTGTRHRTLLAAARTLGRLVGGGELDESVARAALTASAAGFVGRAGYTARQVDRDITDGLEYGKKLPRQLDDLGASTAGLTSRIRREPGR